MLAMIVMAPSKVGRIVQARHPIGPGLTCAQFQAMPVEIFLAAGVLYLLMTFVFTQGYRQLERRLNRHLLHQR